MNNFSFLIGVNVFLYERHSPSGRNCSPWAIKKANARTKNRSRASSHDDLVSRRMDREAEILKSLIHPNIIGYRGFKRNKDGTRVLAIENGQRALMDIVEDRREDENIGGGGGPLPADKILKVVGGVARGLDYLHRERRILHGDMKAANVLVIGDFDAVKICDFGVALRLNENLTIDSEETECYVGTEAWSAPEIILAEDEEIPVTHKADIFSLGCVIYEMLALQVLYA